MEKKRYSILINPITHKKLKIVSIYTNQNIQDLIEIAISDKILTYEKVRPELFKWSKITDNIDVSDKDNSDNLIK